MRDTTAFWQAEAAGLHEETPAQGGQATAHPTEVWRRYDRIMSLTSAAYVAHAEGQTPGTRVYLREAMAEIREWLDRLPPSSPAVTTEQETVERLAGEAVGDTPASLAAISQAHEMLGLWRARLLAQEKG